MSERNFDRDRLFDDVSALSYDEEEIAPPVTDFIEEIPWAEIVDENESEIEMEGIWFQHDERPEPFPLPPIPVVVFVLFLIAFLL